MGEHFLFFILFFMRTESGSRIRACASDAATMKISAATVGYEDYKSENLRMLCNTSQSVVWDADAGITYSQAENICWLSLFLLIIAGNFTVILWRCSTNRNQRNSIPSILVMNLAAADFLQGAHVFIYLLLYSDWLCFDWLLNSSIPTTLCYISGTLGATSVYLSGMITATIAFYYAQAVFGRRCCKVRCSRAAVISFLGAEWIIAILSAGGSMALSVEMHGTAYQKKSRKLSNSSFDHIPTNLTVSFISLQNCIPIGNAITYFAENSYSANPAITFAAQVELAAFGLTNLLVLLSAGIYVAIIIKLLRHRASNALQRNPSARLGGLGMRLIAIAVITFLCWATAIPLRLFVSDLSFIPILPFALIALCNPLTFTLMSRPFLNTVKKAKRLVFFKFGRAIAIQDVTMDSDSLIATRAPSSDS